MRSKGKYIFTFQIGGQHSPQLDRGAKCHGFDVKKCLQVGVKSLERHAIFQNQAFLDRCMLPFQAFRVKTSPM